MKRIRLAERRKTVGLSQEALAEIVGVDRSTVFRWESAANDPQPWQRPRLAKALILTGEELAVLLADVGEAPSRPDERFDYVLTNPASVDLVTVAYLRQQIQHLAERYDQTPSSSLLATGGQLHGQTIYLRAHVRTSVVRRELCAAEAESATLMGQLVWDASQRRDHLGAIGFFDRAIVAARELRDCTTEAHAELRKSYVALYGMNDPRFGLVLTQRASGISHGQSEVIGGLAALHMAEAYAMLGDQDDCETALSQAQEHFAGLRTDDPASAHYCPSSHGRLAGSCYLYLGLPAKAEPILDATHKLLKAGKKSTGIVLGNLSLACIRQRKVEDAAARLHQAIDVLERTRGGGGLNVVFAAARELKPWRNESVVAEVNDRLLTLMSAT